MAMSKIRFRQTGSTMISLMVGMVICLMTVVAALALYRNVGNTVFRANSGTIPAASQDGQLTSGLLRAQNVIQGAGFGIPAAATATNFLLLSGAVVAAPSSASSTSLITGASVVTVTTGGATGNAVLWQTNPNLGAATGYGCGGLVSDSTTRALYYISIATGCTALTTQYNTATWNVVTLIGPNVLGSGQAVTFSARNTAAGTSACWPFGELPQTISGMAPPVGNLRVDIGYQNSTGNAPNTYRTCLVNYKS